MRTEGFSAGAAQRHEPANRAYRHEGHDHARLSAERQGGGGHGAAVQVTLGESAQAITQGKAGEDSERVHHHRNHGRSPAHAVRQMLSRLRELLGGGEEQGKVPFGQLVSAFVLGFMTALDGLLNPSRKDGENQDGNGTAATDGSSASEDTADTGTTVSAGTSTSEETGGTAGTNSATTGEEPSEPVNVAA